MAKPEANRSDLLVGGPGPSAPPPGGGQPNGQPVQVPTGLPYGENQALAQAQQAVPLPKAPGAPAPTPPAGPGGGGDPLEAAQNFQMPQLDLERPTERPNEPVTTPSTGSPMFGSLGAPAQVGSMAQMLAQVASASQSPVVSQLAARAAGLGQ